MKKSSVVIIFLGFVPWVELLGTVAYRTLVNDNSRKKEGGLESNYFNADKTKNGIEEFDRQGSNNCLARVENRMIPNQVEEQGVTSIGKDEGWGQGDVGEEDSREKAGVGVEKVAMQDSLGDVIENGSFVEGGKGSCTCGIQGGIGGVDAQEYSGGGSEQKDTETQKDGLDDGTEENGDQNYIEGAAGEEKVVIKKEEVESKQPGSEMGGAGGKVEYAETTHGDSDEQRGIGVESSLEESTEKEENEENGEMIKNGGKDFDTSVQTIRFSALNR